MNYSSGISVKLGQKAEHLKLPISLHEPFVRSQLHIQKGDTETSLQNSQVLSNVYQGSSFGVRLKNLHLSTDVERPITTTFNLLFENNMPGKAFFYDELVTTPLGTYKPNLLLMALWEASKGLSIKRRNKSDLMMAHAPELRLKEYKQVLGFASPGGRTFSIRKTRQAILSLIGKIPKTAQYTWELILPPFTAIAFMGDVSVFAAMNLPFVMKDAKNMEPFDPEETEYKDSAACLENLTRNTIVFSSPQPFNVWDDMTGLASQVLEDRYNQDMESDEPSVFRNFNFSQTVADKLAAGGRKGNMVTYRVYPGQTLSRTLQFTWKASEGLRPLINKLNQVTQEAAERNFNLERDMFLFTERPGIQFRNKIIWTPQPYKAELPPTTGDPAIIQQLVRHYRPKRLSIVNLDIDTQTAIPELINASIPLTWAVEPNLSLQRELDERKTFIENNEFNFTMVHTVAQADNLHEDYDIQLAVNNHTSENSIVYQLPGGWPDLVYSAGLWPKNKRLQSSSITVHSLPTVIDISLFNNENGQPLAFKSNQFLRYQVIVDLVKHL